MSVPAANEAAPLRQFRPVVVPTDMILGLIGAGFLAIFPAMFAFMISNALSRNHFEPVFGWGIGVYIAACLLFASLMAMKVFLEPGQTVYSLYSDRLEYYEGFLTRVRRTLMYDSVLEIELQEGVLQRNFGAGTIKLTTRNLLANGEGKLSSRIIHLYNIPEPVAAYELLRSLIKPQSSSQPDDANRNAL